MTRQPFTSGELGLDDAALDQLGAELETPVGGTPPPSRGFHERVLAAVEAADPPRRSWLATVLMPGSGAAWRGATLGLVLVLGVTAALMAGGLLDGLRRSPGVGTSPAPSETVQPTITPSPPASPSGSPSPSPSPSPAVSPHRSTPASVQPSATPARSSDPSPSESEDESETVDPGESDSSGPGDGGGESSGPDSSDG